jgi:hypothetical protein
MSSISHPSYRFLIPLILSAIILPTDFASARYSKNKDKRSRNILQQLFNPNYSGIGEIRVEKRMVKEYAKAARRAKTKSCEKQFERRILVSLRRIARYKKLRRDYSYRGLWRITVQPGGREFLLHVTSHNQATDFVSGQFESLARVPQDPFIGWERFNGLRTVSESVAGQYYLFLTIPRQNKSVFSGEGGFLSSPEDFFGTRIGSP